MEAESAPPVMAESEAVKPAESEAMTVEAAVEKPEKAMEAEDEPEAEHINNGNGNGHDEAEDKPEEPPAVEAEAEPPKEEETPEVPEAEEKMDTTEEPPEAKDEDAEEKGEEKAEAQETPASDDPFDKMISGEDDKKDEPKEESKDDQDPFDKMAEGSDDKDKKKDDEDTKPDEDTKSDDADTKQDEDTKKDSNEEEESKKETSEDGDKPSEAAATTISSLDALEDDDKKPNEDDVVDLVTSDKVPNDDKYYEELKTEELDYLKDNMPSVDSVIAKLQCTICAKIMDPVIGTQKGAQRHPHLGISMCHGCRKFYGDGDWPRSEDGDEYCRMCGQGGDILLCDNCPNAFCKKCLQRNLGSRALREITKSENWNCLLCDPKPIYSLKAVYYCLYKNQDEIKERREKEREKEKEKEKEKRKRKSDVTAKEKDALIKSPQNFLEENISEAFKTLEVYQKSLETERTRCIKTVKEGMSVEMATSITRKLRKLYAVTQKNMDLLDRAIVESFVENFPMESTRIHMGRVAPNDPPTPIKKLKKRVAPAAKNKIKIKAKAKGKAKAPPPKKGQKGKGVIRMNGAPVYRDADDLVVPSIMGKKKKKRKNESDVECIDVSESDSEYYNPKKKFRPGPASSKKAKPGPASAKKKKMGPKSKTNFY